MTDHFTSMYVTPSAIFQPGCPPPSSSRSLATHSTLPQVRPEPSRGRPQPQGRTGRASQAACEINSSAPSSPGTETTGRIRPPGSASHSRGRSAAAGRRGAYPITQSCQGRPSPRVWRCALPRVAIIGDSTECRSDGQLRANYGGDRQPPILCSLAQGRQPGPLPERRARKLGDLTWIFSRRSLAEKGS